MTGTRIEIPAGDGSTEAYVARPDRGEHPGVLMLPDAIGLRPQIEQMADRVAGWGYTVVVPHLFHRAGTAAAMAPQGDLREPGEREAFFEGVMPLIRQYTSDLASADLAAWTAALHGVDGVADGPAGVHGYCMGGRIALQAAVEHPDDFAAVGFFHAAGLVTESPDSLHRRVGALRAEVLAGHADRDGSNPAEAIVALDEALDSAGVTRTTATYPDAPHGYSMADTSMYQEAGAERHFAELEALYARTLG